MTSTITNELLSEVYNHLPTNLQKKLQGIYSFLPKSGNRKYISTEYIYKHNDGRRDERKTYSFYVGQKLHVTDGSYNVDANTGVHRNGIDKLFTNHTAEIVVVNTGVTTEASQGEVTLNLLVKFTTGELVFVAPNCIQVFQNS
jgi:hypothetical protein